MPALGMWEQLKLWTLPAGRGCPHVGGRTRWLCRCVPDVRPGGGGRGRSCSACAAGRRPKDPARGRPARAWPRWALSGALWQQSQRPCLAHGWQGNLCSLSRPPASGRSPAASLGLPQPTLLTQSTSSPRLLPLQALGWYSLCDSYLLLILFPCHNNTNYTFSSLLIPVSCSDEPHEGCCWGGCNCAAFMPCLWRPVRMINVGRRES